MGSNTAAESFRFTFQHREKRKDLSTGRGENYETQ
jgi:hypothetical protein